MRIDWILSCFLIAVGPPSAQDQPPAERVAALFQDQAQNRADATDFAQTPHYRELVAALLEMKPADVAARNPVDLDVARALADPDSLRGTWVRVRGYVAGRQAIPLDPAIREQQRIERAFMQLGPETAVACDLIGDPPSYKNQADTVEVCGVFYRTVSYEGKHGKRFTVPYVLARSMEILETPSSGMAKSLFRGRKELSVGVTLGLGGVLLFVLYLRRSARSET